MNIAAFVRSAAGVGKLGRRPPLSLDILRLAVMQRCRDGAGNTGRFGGVL